MTTTPSGSNLWVEPASAASVETPPEYPYNHIQQTESGHSFELDDTPGRERVRLQHRSKTFMEMHPNGDEVHKIVGDGYEIIAGRKNVLIRGDCNITIQGDCNMQIMGDFNQKVNGDYNLAVVGKTNIRSSKQMDIHGDADVSIAANENFGGTLSLSAADALSLGSDLYVHGSITCDTLSAESRINAGVGVSAGPAGFTSAFGGISLGFPSPLAPVAIPGCCTALFNSFSGLSSTAGFTMSSPTALHGLMSSVLMTDITNAIFHNVHAHITGTPGAPTSPSLIPFI